MNQRGIPGIFLSTTGLLTVYIVLFIITGHYYTHAFEYSGYCTKMCKYGRGGNLCKCSAVHFAGKRQPDEKAVGGGFRQHYRLLTNELPEPSNFPRDPIQVLAAENHVDEKGNEDWSYDVEHPGPLAQALSRDPILKDTIRGYLGQIKRRFVLVHALFCFDTLHWLLSHVLCFLTGLLT